MGKFIMAEEEGNLVRKDIKAKPVLKGVLETSTVPILERILIVCPN